MTQSANRIVVAAFVVIALLIGADVVGDWQSGTSAWHLAAELFVVAVALTGAVAVWRLGHMRLLALRRDLETSRREAEARGREAERFRKEAHGLLRGLGAAIDEQFARWGLTEAEREVGLLLLKGLSHKDIAGVRGTSERTVREQARALYRKAGLAGRAELSAFFLEDLLLPRESEVEPAREVAAPG